MPATPKTYRELDQEYSARFGKSFGVPFGAFDFTEQDFIEEMTYSLETGIPFDPSSPRWRWSTDPLPEDAVI